MDGVGGVTSRTSTGQNLRLRVHPAEVRDLHVSPAFRRDGADGNGHDGLLRRPSARSSRAPRRPRLRILLNAFDIEAGSYVPRVNEMTDFNSGASTPACSRHRSARGAPGRQGLHPVRQPHDDEPSDPYARLRLQGHRHRWRLIPEPAQWPEVSVDVAVGQMRASSSSPTRRATGRSTATSRTTPMNAMATKSNLHRREHEGLRPRSARSRRATCLWAETAWARWARWRCRRPTTRPP